MNKKEYCIGIIMDGNRRWAKERGKNAFFGHQAGLETLITFLKSYQTLQGTHSVSHYIFYAFSTENWNRSKEEVLGLMTLLEQGLDKVRETLLEHKNPPRLRVIGDTARLSPSIQEKIITLEEETKQNTGTAALAISYGGRDEIVRACRKLEGKEITEESFAGALDTRDIPDPNLIIRTGREHRLSNFLTWQSAYSELSFQDVLWPDFSVPVFEEIMSEFMLREARHGR